MTRTSGLQLPALAQRHKHGLVKALADKCHLIFSYRDALAQPIEDQRGRQILPALPELLMHPLKDEAVEEFERRRSDYMQGFLSTLLVQVSAASYDSKAILTRHHATADDKMMGLRELAIEAGLIGPDYRGSTPSDPGDRVERYTRHQRRAGILAKTKEHRERKPDGSYRATGNGIRRLSWKWLIKLGGEVARQARRAHAWAKQQREKARAEREEAERDFHESVAAWDRTPDPDELEAQPEPDPDAVYFDLVEQEHPDWIENNEIARINAEVRRLKADGARDTS